MNEKSAHSIAYQRHQQLLTTLEQLLNLQITDIDATLDQAAQILAEILAADKIDIFFYEPANNTLLARGNSDTPMSKRQQAIGLDRLPLANGGRVVETFQTGKTYLTGHADQDEGELPGLKSGLGVVSEIIVTFQVQQHQHGVLAALSSKPDFFSSDDARFLEAVANWLGTIIAHAQLLDQTKQEAMEQGQRMAAEDLITIVAHDLNNYLTPLSSRIDLITRRAKREQQDKYLHDAIEIKYTLSRLEKIINDLLDVARLRQNIFSIQPQVFDFIELAQAVMRAFSSSPIIISEQIPDEIIISGDRDRIHQVIENLLSNAIKHALPSTPIEVNLYTQERENNNQVVLIVENQSSTIPTNLLDALKQPFVKKSDSSGLGLGLYLANGIAQAHQGQLQLKSIAGSKVQAILTLPVEDR